MHPAFSVIFLTTLSGVGQGLFLALFTGHLYSVIKVVPMQADPQTFYGLGSLIALLFLGGGLLASFFHLGRPERGWRAIAQWRTSWLSREVIVLPAFMGLLALYGLVQYLDWNPYLFDLGPIHVDLALVTGTVTTIMAFVLFLCTGMIYACIKFLQEWATPLTVVNYTLLGAASGFTLATAFAALYAPELVTLYGTWAIIITLTALITRVASLLRNARIKHKSSLQTALGMRHTQIVQKSQGSMGGSFNTREFFHGRSARFLKSIKWIFLVLVFPVPVLLLAAGLSPAAFAVLLTAFVVQYLGLIAERWFFFAQSNHPQNLYYQTI
ncbi:MAG: DmsC/YnfH family molybdoenzyme membrane anchor subunit [Thiohalobacteraceae bacterium]|nr:dimethyl sulfoxide reductase anchor subunit [Gammaproteobacteria bacterium]